MSSTNSALEYWRPSVAKLGKIVEGKVIESQSYYGKDDEIYTAHTIKLYKVWSNEFRDDHLTIITLGGTVGDISSKWRNLLTLSEGSQGIFFLQPTVRPLIQNTKFSNEQKHLQTIYYKPCQGVSNLHILYKKHNMSNDRNSQLVLDVYDFFFCNGVFFNNLSSLFLTL